MERLSFLRIYGSAFVGHDLTYLLLARDVFYGMSCIVLISKIFDQRSSQGISLKSQVLYALAFGLRMTDHVTDYYINYDFVSTLAFMSFSVFILSAILGIFGNSFETEEDTFWLNPLIYCTNLLALFFNYSHMKMTIPVVLWAWSHYLKAVAILPQLWLMAKYKNRLDSRLLTYINFQATCRILDILHWTYLYNDVDSLDRLEVLSDAFHIAAHCTFFLYLWVKRSTPQQESMKETIVNLDTTGWRPSYSRTCSVLKRLGTMRL